MAVRLDLRKLEAFDRRAVDGAATATARLAGLTGVETTVDCSRLAVVSAADFRELVDGDDVVAVGVSLEGRVEGEGVAVFDRESALELAEAFVPAGTLTGKYAEKHEDAVAEICSVMVSGYVDGWADRGAEPIETSPPVVVSSAIPGKRRARDVVAPLSAETAPAVSHWSSIATPDGDVTVQLFQFLDPASTMTLFGAESDDVSIDDETLVAFREAVGEGADRVLERARELAPCRVEPGPGPATVEIVPAERLSSNASDDERVGVVVELTGTPRGYVLALTDPASARAIEDAFDLEVVDGRADLEGGETDEYGAVDAIGTSLVRALVSSLEERLPASIATSEPTLVADMESSILNDAVVNMGPDERFVLDFETRIEAADGIECVVYTLIRPVDVPGRWCES